MEETAENTQKKAMHIKEVEEACKMGDLLGGLKQNCKNGIAGILCLLYSCMQ